ncbi:hypothetical protein Indivirus_1_59 [Indivirus ILV1]|uniref:Uncharacterized protein n=1 Tax=Indivirus ILV1 TaxID=1977633 RepID=A0A1V0SCJ7_9VIRU|nr:hypothetical protein Indivirus_1_59 [Indivirus ILV1]
MDNYYPMCPPKMQDQGRQLSDFQSETRRNEYIKYTNNIYRDDQYRLFLQNNGKEIMDREWEYHKTHNKCWVDNCVHSYPTRVLSQQMAQEKAAYDARSSQTPNKQCDVSSMADYRMTSNTF